MKSWISKALLGLCIAAPAMAKLPVLQGGYGGIAVSTSGGFTTMQSRAIRNGFGVWLQGLQRDMGPGSSNYRLVSTTSGDPDLVATVSVRLVAGESGVACVTGEALDNCAVQITGDDGSSNAVTVKVFTQFRRWGALHATPISDPTVFQNIAIRTAGRILGIPLSDAHGMPMYRQIHQEAKWPNAIYLPALVELDQLASLLGLGGLLPYAKPLLQLEKYGTDGKLAGYFATTGSFYNPILDKSFRIQSARWVVNTMPASLPDAQLVQVESSGRYRLGTKNPCFDEPFSPVHMQFYGLLSEQDLGLSVPVRFGAPRVQMVRNSSPLGDYITVRHPGSCLTELGEGVDLYSGM